MLTVPAGFGTAGAGRNPIGVTFVGAAFSEAKLLAAGYAFEQATNVRLAPSFTNPSMWRCVPGSTFFTRELCNPGDRLYTQAVHAAADDAAAAAPIAGHARAGDSLRRSRARGGAGPELRTVRLLHEGGAPRSARPLRIKVTCVPGPSSCRTHMLVTRSGKALATRTVATIRRARR